MRRSGIKKIFEPKIFLLIPAYCCEKQIGRVIAQIDNEIAPWIGEIAIIDNCSPDDTVLSACSAFVNLESLANHYSITFTILQNYENVNLGGSHKSGFSYARIRGYEHVIVLHGDDQANLLDLLPELKSGRYRNYHAILGSRFMKNSHLQGYGVIRFIGNFIFLVLFTIFTGKRTLDMGSGLNLYGPEIINSEDYMFAADNLTFHCYFLLKMYSNQRNLRFFPITWREEDQKSNARLISQAWEIFTILLSYMFQRRRFLSRYFGTFRNLKDYKCIIVHQKLRD
jgi:hypothetical protein